MTTLGPSPAEEPYAAEIADSSGISQDAAALWLPPLHCDTDGGTD